MVGIGEQIGPYLVTEELGHGGMATVYKARHERLNRDVALKVMHQMLRQEPDFLARFEREAQIIARMEHRNIVSVYDFSEHEGSPYLVMKYVQGQTLEQKLEAGPLSMSEIVRVMDTVATALDYAHGQRVLHRDVKPSNILIDENDVVYLTDFGLARLAMGGASTMSQNAMIGTPHYIAPEQALGEKQLDGRADVYAFGVVLFELVVGRVPFTGDTPFSVVHDHIYTPLPTPSSINPKLTKEVDQVLQRALAKDPADRYATSGELMKAFRSAVTGTNNAEEAQSAKPQRDARAVNQPGPGAAQRMPKPPVPPAPEVPEPPSISGKPGRHVEWSFGSDGERSMRGSRSPRGRARREASESWGKNWGERIGYFVENVEDWAEQFEDGVNKGRSKKERNMTPEERVRLRVKKKLKARQELMTHLIVYVMVNLLLWVIWGLVMFGQFPWPLIVMAGWGIGVVANVFEYRNEHGAGADHREAIMQRELELARQRGEIPASEMDKLKNEDLKEDLINERFRLSDDGELTDSFITELEEMQKPKRRDNT